MKRSELIRRIRRAARPAGLTFEFDRQGKEHELWVCGRAKVSIPRHREINERTAEGICRDLEPELGEGWWRGSIFLRGREGS
jgi:hypothetical protein